MIIVITVKEINENTGREHLIVSHGIDKVTGKAVILPCETPAEIGAVFNTDLGEYVLPSNSGSTEDEYA